MADKPMVLMKNALAHYTVQVGDQTEPAEAAVGDLRDARSPFGPYMPLESIVHF
jgi:hypothetical protein